MEGNAKLEVNSRDVRVAAFGGGSNVGHAAVQAAYDLVSKEKVAGFLCVAAMGARHEGMTKSAKKADIIVSIDECPTTKALQNAGIEPAIVVIVTELGLDKSIKDLDLNKELKGSRESKGRHGILKIG